MKKSTIVRTIMYTIVMINIILKFFGKSPISISETVVNQVIECLISVSVLLLTFWKNNSFTKKAQKADRYLEQLKKLNKQED